MGLRDRAVLSLCFFIAVNVVILGAFAGKCSPALFYGGNRNSDIATHLAPVLNVKYVRVFDTAINNHGASGINQGAYDFVRELNNLHLSRGWVKSHKGCAEDSGTFWHNGANRSTLFIFRFGVSRYKFLSILEKHKEKVSFNIKRWSFARVKNSYIALEWQIWMKLGNVRARRTNINPSTLTCIQSTPGGVCAALCGIGVSNGLVGDNGSKQSINRYDIEGSFFPPNFLALAGLMLVFCGFAGESFFWGRLNKDFATNMHIARDTSLLLASAITAIAGMVLLIAHFSPVPVF